MESSNKSLLAPFIIAAFAPMVAEASLVFTPVGGAPVPGAGLTALPGSNFSLQYTVQRGTGGGLTAPTIGGYAGGTFGTNSYNYGDPIGGPYTGTGYDGQNSFFNQFTGSSYTPLVQFDVSLVGDIGSSQHDLFQTTNPNGTFNHNYDIDFAVDSAVTSLTFTYRYLGDPNVLSPGITGLHRSATNFRPIIASGIHTGFGHTIDASITGSGIDSFPAGASSTNAIFQSGDFHSSIPGSPFDPFDRVIAPTIGGGGTTANVTLDRGSDRSWSFHNGADLGSLINTVSVTYTPSGGGTFGDGRFRFSFDGMAVVIPEPSRAILLLGAAFALLMRRRRNH